MGSGKSTLGKRLAKRLAYDFVDMDHYIEEQQGLKVAEIFEQKGESFFRTLETGFIESLETDKNLVIATGGGVPCFGKNMNLMNQKGVTVYLKLNPASLAGRLENAREIRPLIASIPKEQLIDYIETKLSEREPYYKQARCIIKGENVKPEHVVSLVFGKE
jgi:shikimate kinase